MADRTAPTMIDVDASAPPDPVSCPAARGGGGRAWLQLVRAPNLLSAYGDPIAGACLVGIAGATGDLHRVLMSAVAAVAVYAAGMVDNDLVDLDEDRRDRPQRPLPSGAIRVPHARMGRVVLFLVPYCIAAVWHMPAAWVAAHLLLLLACLAYNRVKGRSLLMGALFMGACRAISMLSGMVLGTPLHGAPPWFPMVALPWLAYVGGICLFAAHETSRVPGCYRYLLAIPPLSLALVGLLAAMPDAAAPFMIAGGLCGVVLVLDVTLRLSHVTDPMRVPPSVGRLVRVLIPMQAVLALAAAPCYGIAFCLLLLVSWPIAEGVGRRFYAS